jgi:hypothetical protein
LFYDIFSKKAYLGYPIKQNTKASYLPPLFLRTKLAEAPIQNGIFTDFAPTLHRLWYGGTTDLQRTWNEGNINVE